jgi:hypothetical protein
LLVPEIIVDYFELISYETGDEILYVYLKENEFNSQRIQKL